MHGPAHRYLVKVLRLRPGDTLTLFDGQGHEAEAKLQEVGPTSATLELGAIRRIESHTGPSVTLFFGLPKGEKTDLIVQKATELGADRIVPVFSERSIPLDRPERVPERLFRWQKIATEAARQSGRAAVPEVTGPRSWKEVMAECQSGEAVPGGGASFRPTLKFVLDPAGQRALPKSEGALGVAPVGHGLRVFLLVGPEGGLSATEMADAHAAGFASLGLSAHTLRAETAAISAVAIVKFCL